MDPLSDVLALLDVRAALPSRFEATGRWALRFEPYQHLKVGAVLEGHCWISSEGSDPVHLRAGECYLLASGRSFTSASDLDTEPADGMAVFARSWPDTVYHTGAPTGRDDPGRTVLVGGAVMFDDTTSMLLLDNLPSCVRIAADSHRATVLRPTLELLGAETSADSPGSATMREQLTTVLFVQALRTLLYSDAWADGRPTGWLGALGDQHVGAALTVIHREPSRRWTVADLAAEAGMSRSGFALRFRTQVGLTPLDYLARWRVRSAARALRSTDRTVASIAAEFGYASEGAFSSAFKRVTGQAPTEHRRAPEGMPVSRGAGPRWSIRPA
ncbi:AraC family transcriptional regulator [Sphaerisporangium corydalis]|uniref:AraC family transcriptional regulator n=1 Tax=Sphaerisporangium corydalis TaxID=1441875 RepID=A0ABV9EIP0_9ACTN|nr:AraC family transcriptional regulator [Sphaerisporangium corydalis]